MNDATFNRGLDDEFVSTLNEMYRHGDWWSDFVDDRDTFVAIRNNSVNVYYRGASLLRIDWSPRSRSIGRRLIHYKYLLLPDREEDYMEVAPNGDVELPLDVSSIFLDHVDVEALKRTATRYADEEKMGVHAMAMNRKNAVVDIEVAISEGPRAPRIDIAALTDTDECLVVRFFEAKTFRNPDLRAKEGGTPEVVQQIQGYSRLLVQNSKAMTCSYRRVCRNFRDLDGFGNQSERRAMIDALDGGKSLVIDPRPQLVVFGFDADQKVGKVWVPHRDRLKSVPGLKLLLRRDPKELSLHR